MSSRSYRFWIRFRNQITRANFIVKIPIITRSQPAVISIVLSSLGRVCRPPIMYVTIMSYLNTYAQSRSILALAKSLKKAQLRRSPNLVVGNWRLHTVGRTTSYVQKRILSLMLRITLRVVAKVGLETTLPTLGIYEINTRHYYDPYRWSARALTIIVMKQKSAWVELHSQHSSASAR